MENLKKIELQNITLKTSIEQSFNAIAITDIEGKIEYINPAFSELTQYSKEELLGKNPKQLKSGTHPQSFYKNLWQTILAGNTWKGQFHNKRKDSSLYWEKATITPIKNDNGVIINFLAIKEDITDQIQAELALKKSEKKFIAFFDTNPSATFVWKVTGEDFLLTEVNQAAQNITNNRASLFIGKKASEIYQDLPEIIKKLNQCVKSKSTINFEHYYKNRNQGTYDWVNFRLAFLEPDTILLYSDLITDRKKAELALQESEKKYRFLIERVSDVIWQTDINHKFTYCSPAMEFQRGYKPEEVLGKTPFEFLTQSSLDQIMPMIKKRKHDIASGKKIGSIVFEVEQYCKNGNTIWVEVKSLPVYDENDTLKGFQGITRDISKQKQATLALKQSEERLREGQRIAQMGNWDLDIRENTLYWSDEIYHIFDCEPQEFKATYEAFLNFIHPEDREMVHQAYQNSLITKQPYEMIHRLTMRDGKIKYVKEKCNTTFDENGNPVISRGIVLDITQLKEQEIKLQQYSQQLEKANATKDKFFRIISHDLRSPFNGLIGLSELLHTDLDKLNDELIKTYAATIHELSQSTYQLLENLLEWSRSQTDQIKFQPEHLPLEMVINEIRYQTSDTAKKKNIALKFSFKEGLNLNADKNMLNTILRNLINNAIKFTYQGGEISVNVLKKTDEILFSVSDNGVGMDAATLDKLFKIEEKTSNRGTEGETGTGLGLLLCKEFVKKHGGNIWPESQKGKGSTFKFTIPQN